MEAPENCCLIENLIIQNMMVVVVDLTTYLPNVDINNQSSFEMGKYGRWCLENASEEIERMGYL